MIIQSARLAARDLFAPKSRSVMLKSFGLTILLLLGLWFVMEAAVETFLVPLLGPWPWAATAMVWMMGTGMIVGMAFLIGPVTAIFAGLFLDDVAQYVEERYFPASKPGKPLPVGLSTWLAVKFFGLVLLANFIALLLVLLPGINFAIFFFVNGYLLGREYFQFAAMRFRPESEAKAVYNQHSTTVIMAGLIVAGFMSVPLLNLATPMFAGALMAHLHKKLSGEEPQLIN